MGKIAVAATAKAGWIERACRNLLEKRLVRARKGCVTILDGSSTKSFGSPHDALDATITVHDQSFYRETAFGGSLGSTASFMRGDWSCDDVTALSRWLIVNQHVFDAVDSNLNPLYRVAQRLLHFYHRNTRRGSQKNIAAHYDLGNDFFRLFLDETMMYSCAYFPRPESTLVAASTAKIEKVCRKLELSPADHLLEIGTGWGGFALHAAKHHGCRITTTTISRAQYDLATRRIADAGLSDRVEVIRRDYRDLTGQYDKLVSIEMIEAVGHKFLRQYFGACGRLLKPKGRMLLQAITIADQSYDRYVREVDFIRRYIFPGGCLPAVSAIGRAVKQATNMQFYHLEDMTPHYARTLQCWRSRFFERSDEVRAMGFPEEFLRMWELYFSLCEAAFLERRTQSIQLLLVNPACHPNGEVFAA